MINNNRIHTCTIHRGEGGLRKLAMNQGRHFSTWYRTNGQYLPTVKNCRPVRIKKSCQRIILYFCNDNVNDGRILSYFV